MKIPIKKLAKMAHIRLQEPQIAQLESGIETILAYMEVVKNLDVDKVPETFRVSDEVNVFREDEIKPSLPQEKALRSAKKTYNGFFVVPVILEDAIKE